MVKSFWSHCLIGSTVLHIGLFIVIKNMSPAAHVSLNAVEAFIVAPCVACLPESERTSRPTVGTDVHSRIQGAGQLQTARQEVITATPHADHNSDVKSSPLKDAADIPVSQTAQGVTQSKTLVNAAPVSNLPSRAAEDQSGSKPSAPAKLNQGTGPVMTMGDVGSPRFIHRELPVYPFMARKLGKEGKVVLRLALDAQGRLQGIDTVETSGFGFADAARIAIGKSTFEPAVSDGRAISSQVLVPIRFVLN